MKSDVENLSPTRVKVSVDLPFTELGPHLDKAYKAIAAQVTVPGFRKGKVPTRIIDQRFGRGAVLEEAVNSAIPEAYNKAISESGVFPVGQPEVDVTELNDGQNLVFTAEVDVRPEFEAPTLVGVEVEVAVSEVTEEDVAAEIDQLRARFGTLTDKDGPVAVGDTAVVSLAAQVDGTDLPDLSAEELNVAVGEGSLIPGLDEAITGAVAGEARTFSFTPEGGEREGQQIEITATVKDVKTMDLPEADDEFAMLASQFDTLAEMRADLETRLSTVKQMQQESQAMELLRKALLERVDFPLPEGLVKAEVDSHFKDAHGDDAHRAEFEEQVRERLRTQFLLDKLAEEAKVEVSQDEITQWIVRQAPRYQMAPEQFAEALVQADQVGMAVSEVRQAKTLEWAVQQITVRDTNGQVVDLRSQAQAFAEMIEAAKQSLQAQGLGEMLTDDDFDEPADEDELDEEENDEDLPPVVAEALAKMEQRFGPAASPVAEDVPGDPEK
ncbi:MAG: trigger factor [Candidatus Nanopelagicales bacterium]